MNYLAIDLGAESGRVILGSVIGDRISIEEIHRVPNQVRRENDSILWDIYPLWFGIDDGLRKVSAKKIPIWSVSADSWGVDYILLSRPITDLNTEAWGKDFTLLGNEVIGTAF